HPLGNLARMPSAPQYPCVVELCWCRRGPRVAGGVCSSPLLVFVNVSGGPRRLPRPRRKIDPRIQSELFVESGLELREGLPAPKGAWAGSECDLRFFFCSADKFVQYLRFCSDRIYPNNDHHRHRPTRVDHCLSPHLSIFLFSKSGVP